MTRVDIVCQPDVAWNHTPTKEPPMPRVTHVKRAQPRFATRPVLGGDGKQVRTPVMSNGEQKVTKNGVPIFMGVTERDRSHPLPPLDCEACHLPIQPGTPYKHVTPKSGPYGGRQRHRHEFCPDWQPWDLSNSLSARIQQVQHDARAAIESAETDEDVRTAIEEAAAAVQELAEEKREGASNIVDGFGHDTEQSMALEEVAEQLDAWAGEIEGIEVPDFPEPEEEDCEECEGTGTLNEGAEDAETDCETCGGTGRFTPDDPTEDQITEWLDLAIDNAFSVLDESPV